eukprot:CAMPEP_0118667696 /NCGR_PEP_ID=MMETSP0785-20121206/19934_1 /TAXON_ID=91992 /ORGANISM="Bolidomonas pacifica, Strain CCMP 1866" /LENGTH=419 /DNA_ID=CAMNT_0006562187 /DNA_START=18 /DNA_END=1277 /DNA_ORIENTATION=-
MADEDEDDNREEDDGSTVPHRSPIHPEADVSGHIENVRTSSLDIPFGHSAFDRDVQGSSVQGGDLRDSVDGIPPRPPGLDCNVSVDPVTSPLIKVPAESVYVYKGLKFNPPQVVKRGLSRGNTSQLHRKAWLEVSDKYHRYGKNLRIYYREWERLGHPFNMFFDWLDSKRAAAGQQLPNLEECPRQKLDADTVEYIMDPMAQRKFTITIKVLRHVNARINAKGGMGQMQDSSIISCSPPVSSHFQAQRESMRSNRLLPSGGEEGRFGDGSKGDNNAVFLDSNNNIVNTGPEGWIFVLRDGGMYAAPKVTTMKDDVKKRFHHSSFFGGKAVEAAGIIITNSEGRLLRLYPHSGHYRPGEAHLQRTLLFLKKRGLKLRRFDVDLQQIFHVARKEVPKASGETVDGGGLKGTVGGVGGGCQR